MKRDLIIGLLVALVLHGGFALSGDFFKSAPAPAPTDDAVPVIELAPPPPVEPETVDMREPSAEGGGGDLSDLVPPMQADMPSATASPFTQPIQPPPAPTLARSSGPIIPTIGRPGPGIGTGTGGGLQNLFDLASLDEDPVPRVRVNPVYPHEMSRSGLNGKVTVGFIVDSEGNVRDPYVISSSHREFEPAALRAAARWKFKPGRKNGANVNTRNVQLPFLFSISDN